MAPNKFEKHIKKQLQDREIQPSANAWQRISEQLDQKEEAQKKRWFTGYSIAASLIGFLLVAYFFIKSTNTQDTEPTQIVTTEEAQQKSEIIEEKEILKQQIEAAVVNTETSIDKKKTPSKILEITVPKVENQIAASESLENKKEELQKVQKNEVPSIHQDEIIQTKILEIVAAVDSLEQNANALTDAEVDALLREAQDEIFRDKLFDQNGAVDAMALLTEVEDELDQSFRDQIFESLKEGFLKVRTAVADRNK